MKPLETYIRELYDIKSFGAGVPEASYYNPLANLLNDIGKTLKPKVCCILNLKNQGTGFPESESALWAAAHPRKMVEAHDERFTEYLKRVMLYAALGLISIFQTTLIPQTNEPSYQTEIIRKQAI